MTFDQSFLSIHELHDRLRRRELSAVDYAQDERQQADFPFVLSVAKRKRSEVEGRHDF